MRKFLKSLSLSLRYLFVQLICWLNLKPLHLTITIINIFVGFVARAKSNIMKDIVIHELETNSKFFLTTDNKRSPCGPQVIRKPDDDNSNDWTRDPAIVRMMSEVDRCKENMQKHGKSGMISRTDYPDVKIKTGSPTPTTGYTVSKKSDDVVSTLKDLAQKIRAKGLLEEINSVVDEYPIDIDTSAFEVKPKKKASLKKKVIKKVPAKKKASSKKR